MRAASYIIDGVHEALAAGAEVLEFAPIPGLAQAARVLLDIWDAVQMVDVSTRTCKPCRSNAAFLTRSCI